MRRVGIIIAGIVGIVVIAVLVFAATFNVNKYRGTIQSQLQKHLGRSVTLGDMHLRVFPPGSGFKTSRSRTIRTSALIHHS